MPPAPRDRRTPPTVPPTSDASTTTTARVAEGDPVPDEELMDVVRGKAPSPRDFAEIAQALLVTSPELPTAQRVVELAVETVDGCHYCGVSLRHANGRVDTPACTDELVARADALQYELHEGPCLDAIRADELYVVEDLANDPRWPNWGPKAAALGFGGILSVRLAAAQGIVGALNLYSSDIGAFDDDAVQVAYVYAAHAANALWATREVEGLRTAMRSRHLIGMAQGVLMERHRLTEESSFEVLRRYSQIHNIKLRQVATLLLANLRDETLPSVAP
jgi:GAF domain-containing protein